MSNFFDFMILPTPITKIDTIDQLFNSDMKIVTRYNTAFYTYLTSIESPLVDRIETNTNFIFTQDEFDALRTGSLAYVNKKFLLIFRALEFNALFNMQGSEDFMDSLHISEDDGGSEPYFIVINDDLDQDIINDFNIM